MSSVALLLGLLVVAYVGSSLMSGKGAGYRLPSGAEYLLLGVAVGPYALGVFDRSSLAAFQPLAVVGTAWITLVIGADYAFQNGRRVSLRGMIAGIVLAACTAAAIGFAVYQVGSRFALLDERELRIACAGIALGGCELTRAVVGWVTSRNKADGPLTRFFADVADSDDVVAIIGMAVAFPLVGTSESTISLGYYTWAEITAGLGVVLGGTAAALLRAEPRASEGWGVILGAALLGTGIAWRLGLAPQAATFAIGLSLPALSRHGVELRAMLARTEQPVLLPTLLLAGASVEIFEPLSFAAFAGAALVARFAVRLIAGPALAALAGAPQRASGFIGAGAMSSGALSVAVGLAFASRFPGRVGGVVLGVVAVLLFVGELVGPASMKQALLRAGEIVPAPEPLPAPVGEPEPVK